MMILTDSDIRKNVERELQWDPEIVAADIAVTVKSKVVTLDGFVRALGQKMLAERDAKRVVGVRAVANDIDVRLGGDARFDAEIARDAVLAIRSQLPPLANAIRTLVDNGYVKLEGAVEWDYQRRYAENVVRRIRGVKGLVNRIVLRPNALPVDVKHRIEDALRRSADIESERIRVAASAGDVTLSGQARSWAERDEIERAAWMAPGVVAILNQITVSP
jgi:osmotically-inducible protein OsmY